MWVDRDKRPPQTDAMGVLPGAVTAQAAELVNFDAAPQEEHFATFGGAVAPVANFMIVDAAGGATQTDTLSALAGTMTPTSALLFVDGAGQSETIAQLAGAIAAANQFMLVEPAAQSDGLSTFAGTITPTASQP